MNEIIHAEDKSIAARVERPTHPDKGYALSLHGGGLSTKEATDYLRDCFTDQGFGMVSFDCTGKGESSGFRDECSPDVRETIRMELSRFVATVTPHPEP